MNKVYVSMYHYVRNLEHSRYPEIKGMNMSVFRQQIEYLKNNFAIITMEQMIDSVTNGTKLPENALLLTFDDGYIDNYTYVLPILEEYHVQGSFFIPGKTFSTHQLLDVNKIHYILASADINKLAIDLKEKMDFYRGGEYDYASTDELWNEYGKPNRWDSAEVIFVKRMLQTVLPEKLRNRIASELFAKYVGVTEEQLAHELYMTEEQIRAMKRHGMHIGIHGYDHYWLGNLTEEEMKQDVSKALNVLNEFIDEKKWVICYPYGNYNDNVLKYIKECGCALGFTTEVGIADLKRYSPLTLPRFDCNDFPPKSENYLNY